MYQYVDRTFPSFKIMILLGLEWSCNFIQIFLNGCYELCMGNIKLRVPKRYIMMTSSNGNIFRVTGPLCGEFTGPGEFPTQRPVTRGFDVFFDMRLNKRLSKQPWGWWFETPSWSLWRHCNVSLFDQWNCCRAMPNSNMIIPYMAELASKHNTYAACVIWSYHKSNLWKWMGYIINGWHNQKYSGVLWYCVSTIMNLGKLVLFVVRDIYKKY